MLTIHGIIRKEINDYINLGIEVVPGYTFNQYQTIKRIHLYTNSQFENNQPYHNRVPIFHNIVNYRRDTAVKSIDIDVKDFKPISMTSDNRFEVFLIEKEFAIWAKVNNVSDLLNDSVDQLCTYGTTVVKTTSEQPELVDLRRFFLDPTVDQIEQSRFIIQEHFMTQSELLKMKGEWDYDKIKQVLTTHGSIYSPKSYNDSSQQTVTGTTPYYKIYERYGEVPRSLLTSDEIEDEYDLVRAQFIVAEPYAMGTRSNGEQYELGIVLHSSEWKDEYPYSDCHFTKSPGRWLGRGIVEELFPAQERINELANQKRISMELSAIHLFQTRDRTVPNNLLKTMQSGQVLVTNQEITPIMNEERNLQAFGSEEVSYQQLADRLTFSYDAGRGEAMPSSTPATNAMIQNNNVQSYFQYKREVFGNFWRKIVNDKILPKLMKDIKGEHVLRLVGTPEEILQFDKEIAPHFIIEQMLHQYTESWYIDEEMLQGVTEKVMSGMKSMGTERFITVLKDAFKDVKHEFDFILTNEQRDTAIQAQNMFQVLSQLAQNPALLDDPVLPIVSAYL